MTNWNYGELLTGCASGDNVKPETAKSILGEMDAILQELSAELRRIDDAIYSPRNIEGTVVSDESKLECFLDTLDKQRRIAKASLDLAIHIREGLW